MVTKVIISDGREERDEEAGGFVGCGRCCFNPNHTAVSAQGQDAPIAEVAIACDKHTIIAAREAKNFRIIRLRLHHVRRSENVMASPAQCLCQIEMKHLIQEQAHGENESGGEGIADLGMLDGGARVEQSGLQVFAHES